MLGLKNNSKVMMMGTPQEKLIIATAPPEEEGEVGDLILCIYVKGSKRFGF